MELAIAILGLVSALVGAWIWFWKRKAATRTRQERIDAALEARRQREQEIDAVIAAGKAGQDRVNNLVEENLRAQNTTAVRRRARIHPSLALLWIPAFAGMTVLLCACATTPPPVVIPADRTIRALPAGGQFVAPFPGYFVPAARMQEILRALADKTLENDLQNAREVSP